MSAIVNLPDSGRDPERDRRGEECIPELASVSSVLLVEDEPRLRQTLAWSLTGRNYRVLEASSAAEAISAADVNRISVVVLDINLPDATGWEVIRRFRATRPALPIVVMSAVPPNPARVREYQPFGVLVKPFPIDSLLRLVKAAGAEERMQADSST